MLKGIMLAFVALFAHGVAAFLPGQASAAAYAAPAASIAKDIASSPVEQVYHRRYHQRHFRPRRFHVRRFYRPRRYCEVRRRRVWTPYGPVVRVRRICW